MILPAATITYDGMDWSVEAFLDGYQFIRDPDQWVVDEHKSRPESYMAVLEDGTLITECEGRMLPWPQVIAFRPAESASALPCHVCGQLAPSESMIQMEGSGDLWCGNCYDEGEWEY